ncbi:MAG: biotin--[acetyl-CoA-carboxylase] ligase, partial [Candidatus Omnitrophica bacterium]|nr:biotin--[acetyl-CoA-carboxylase] ligase [Candidatus Omnitrophota bacterium]
EKWQAFNTTLGKRIKVALEREHLEGEAIDIDKDGGLLVRTDSGFIQKVSSGDVVHCR